VDTDELVLLEDLAVDAAVAAGQLVRGARPDHVAVASTKSSPSDVVTVMDTAAEDLVRSILRAARPHDAILGEERDGERGTSGLTWVVDPIDGTVNYLYGIPAYAVSVAVVTGDPTLDGAWSPVAGAVCHPEAEVVYHARRGAGAWRRSCGADRATGRPLTVSTKSDLGQALVGTGFSYRAHSRAEQAEVLTRVLPAVRDIRRSGSAALDLCFVACAWLDAFYEGELNAWDIAAGWLLVEESGGIVVGLGGGAPTRALTVAGPPALVDRLVHLVVPR
jgi:myo-inositol-1(or 4)-monophosphatase